MLRFQASFRIRGAEKFDSPRPQRHVAIAVAAKFWRVSRYFFKFILNPSFAVKKFKYS